jgi:hypothetical protein
MFSFKVFTVRVAILAVFSATLVTFSLATVTASPTNDVTPFSWTEFRVLVPGEAQSFRLVVFSSRLYAGETVSPNCSAPGVLLGVVDQNAKVPDGDSILSISIGSNCGEARDNLMEALNAQLFTLLQVGPSPALIVHANPQISGVSKPVRAHLKGLQ